MKKTLSKWASILLPVFLGVFLIYYKYNSFTPEQLKEIKFYFKTADYFYIYLSLFIALFGFLSRAYRWKFTIEHMGYHSKFQNNLMAVCAGYFMNLTIPRSGEVTRALVLKKYEDIPFDKSFGTIIAERIVDLFLFLIFVMIAFFSQFKVLKTYLLSKIPLENLLYLGIIFVVLGIFGILVWMYSKLSFILKIKEKLQGLMEGLTSIVKMKNKGYFLFHSFFIWFSYFLMFYVTIFALKETSHISFSVAIIGFVIGSLAIGFTNSGFGAFPLLIAEIFMLYGIPDTAGTAFGWLVWTSQTILTVILGTLSFLLLPILNRQK